MQTAGHLRESGWRARWNRSKKQKGYEGELIGGLMGFGYGSIPINTIFTGMNIHLPAILMWTTGVQGFDTLPFYGGLMGSNGN